MESDRTPSKTSQSPSPHTTEQQLPSTSNSCSLLYYNYSRAEHKKDPQRERHILMIYFLMVLLILSVVLFFAALGVDYLVVSTQYYGTLPNCLWSQVDFDGWSDNICLECQAGYTLSNNSVFCTKQ